MSGMLSFTITIAGQPKAWEIAAGKLARGDGIRVVQMALIQGMDELLRQAEAVTPTGATGKLKASWEKKIRGQRGELINTATYYTWVDQGTGLYGAYRGLITPRFSSRMKFYAYGRKWSLRFTKGQKPQGITDKVIAGIEPAVDDIGENIMRQVDGLLA